MKTIHILVWAALLLLIACSSNDTAGTQTGNPATIGLTYAMNSSTSATRFSRGSGSIVSSVTITEAYLAVSEVRIESGDDAVSFRSEIPFILTFDSSGNSGWLDSAVSKVGAGFEEMEVRLDPMESAGTVPEDSTVLVKGYVNGDPLQVFRFTAAFTEKIRFRNSIEISGEEVTLQLNVDLDSWFYNSDKEEWFDPRSDDNRSDIEGLIKDSFDAALFQ